MQKIKIGNKTCSFMSGSDSYTESDFPFNDSVHPLNTKDRKKSKYYKENDEWMINGGYIAKTYKLDKEYYIHLVSSNSQTQICLTTPTDEAYRFKLVEVIATFI